MRSGGQPDPPSAPRQGLGIALSGQVRVPLGQAARLRAQSEADPVSTSFTPPQGAIKLQPIQVSGAAPPTASSSAALPPTTIVGSAAASSSAASAIARSVPSSFTPQVTPDKSRSPNLVPQVTPPSNISFPKSILQVASEAAASDAAAASSPPQISAALDAAAASSLGRATPQPSSTNATAVTSTTSSATASGLRRLVAELSQNTTATSSGSAAMVTEAEQALGGTEEQQSSQNGYSTASAMHATASHAGFTTAPPPMAPLATDSPSPFRTFRSPPPFYWVQSVETISEFEVGGAFGEVVTKLGDFKDDNNALPIAGTLRMAKGGLYTWTIQVVKQCPHRPHFLFGIHGAAHARPWRLVSSGRCSRSRDDGPWISRPGGDIMIRPGDYLHCEADLRGLDGLPGSFSFAVNAGPFETTFEDIPLSDGPLHPVLCIGGAGTTCRLCDG